jgi:hypothetical protein
MMRAVIESITVPSDIWQGSLYTRLKWIEEAANARIQAIEGERGTTVVDFFLNRVEDREGSYEMVLKVKKTRGFEDC